MARSLEILPWVVPPPLALRVCAEQTRVLYRFMPLAVAASAASATLLSVALARDLSTTTRVVWLAATYTTSLLSVVLWGCFGYARPRVAELPWWERCIVAAAGLNGLTLGCGGLLLHVPGQSDQGFLALLVILNMTLAGLLLASSSARAFIAFVAPVLLLLAFPFLSCGELRSILTGMATLALLPCLWLLAQRLERRQERAIAIRLRLRRLTGKLRTQKRTMEQAGAARSRFLTMSAHDLRQPLHALDLLVKALQEQPLGAEALELVGSISSCVSSLDALFTALLQISRLDAGAISARVVSFPVSALFARLQLEIKLLAQEKQITCTIRGTDAWVRSDPELLLQILRNFIGNAIRHTPAERRVLIGCRQERAGLRIEVRDDGCGIAPQDHQRIFEEFVQLSTPQREACQGQNRDHSMDPSPGAGLGLAIVARLARLLSHRLSLRSAPGRGSVFGVCVPRAPDGETAPPDQPQAQGGAGLSRLNVLVLGEDLPARHAIQEHLTEWGCPALGAASSTQALNALAARGGALDVILVEEGLRAQAAELSAQAGLERPVLLVMAEVGAAQAASSAAAGSEPAGRGEAVLDPILDLPVSPARLRSVLMFIASQRGASQREASQGSRGGAPRAARVAPAPRRPS